MSDSTVIHSSLGASGMERWANCPGSVALNRSIVPLKEAADPEYRIDGTAAHDALAHCQTNSLDAWEVIGELFGSPKIEVTVEMADAIQVFLDEVRPLAEGAETVYVEAPLNDPDHPLVFGTIDFGALKDGTIFVRDYKHGMGIIVETFNNQQMLYYAYLLMLKHPDARKVNMRIMQPRVPYRNDDAWEIPAEDVMEWANKELFPAMERTETDNTLCPGQHCRFCDAKNALACPELKETFDAFVEEVGATVEDYSNGALLANWKMADPVRMHIKALEAETLRRLMENKLPDNGVVKLVNKRADRVWKPEAEALFKGRFGDKALNPPEFKSPAQMEKIDATAKKMVHEYAYTPQSGYTVAPAGDKRPGVTIKKVSETFHPNLGG